MSSFGLKYSNVILLFTPLFLLNFTTILALPSGVHVDGYQESKVPTYPFQQYIQVRHTYTVEHVPYHESPSSHNLQTAASNSGGSKDHQTGATNSNNHHDGGGGGDHYHVPRLREEFTDYTKHEVYEEKGYGDSAYDHHSYKQPTQYYNNDDDRQGDGSAHRPMSASSRARSSLHTPDGSSTKILEYAASNLHDGDAQRKGIYAARSNIHCPEVIDFDLSSKSMSMGNSQKRGGKPRLRGLGSKILCLKNKYFGSEPLPKAIFAEPSEAKESVIETPSFDNFFKMVRGSVNSMSSFQNSNVPI